MSEEELNRLITQAEINYDDMKDKAIMSATYRKVLLDIKEYIESWNYIDEFRIDKIYQIVNKALGSDKE